MTEELTGIGLDVGPRRVGPLMPETAISVVRPRKDKVTTDSDHKCNIAPNLLDGDVTADQPNQKGAGPFLDICCAKTLPGNGYQLCLDATGLVTISRDPGFAFKARDRLSGQQSHET